MNRMKKFFVAFLSLCFGTFCAFAEDPVGTANQTVNNTLKGWIADTEKTMETWAGDLAPLYTLGITILLIVIGWRLFKRTTKTAS